MIIIYESDKNGINAFCMETGIGERMKIRWQKIRILVLMLVFTPVLTKMGVSFGVNPLLVMMLIFYTAMTAYATPAASSNAALIFGNKEWVATKDAYLTGILILLVAFAVLIGVAIPLGQIML